MVEIAEVLKEEFIQLDVNSESKDSAIRELANLFVENNAINDLEKYLTAVFKREEESTTGIGFGVGIPHGKSDAVNYPALAFGRSHNGISYDSMDGKPVYLLFLIAVPESSNDDHLKILSKLSRKLMHEDIRKALIEATNVEEIYNILN